MRTFAKYLITTSLSLIISLSVLSPVFAVEKGNCISYYPSGKPASECCMFNGAPDANIWGLNNPEQFDPPFYFCGGNPASGWGCYCQTLKSEESKTPITDNNQDGQKAMKESDPLNYTPQVSIPGKGAQFTAGKTVEVPANTKLLADYIIAIFKYSTGIVGIIATIVVMIGGVRWLTAAGGGGVSEAKTMIISGISGLALALGSFLLLSTINTSLVNFKIQPIKQVTKIDLFQLGCCEKYTEDADKKLVLTTENLKDTDCRALTGYKQTIFKYGYTAKENKCVFDSEKQACCLYNYDKNNNIASACTSKLMGNKDALNDFRTECKGLGDSADEDKYIKGRFSVEESKECSDNNGTAIYKCVDSD